LFANQRKTEIIAVINEYFEVKTSRKVTIEFSENIQVKLKIADTRTITFRKDESCAQARLKKTQKTLTVGIASGLDKNTDTAPQGVTRPTGTGGRGRGNTGGNTGGGRGVQQPTVNTNTGGGRANQPTPPPVGRVTPQSSNVPKAKASYAYQGQTPDELSFKEGDVIIIHKKDPGGWWEGELNGKRGWIPANYVAEI